MGVESSRMLKIAKDQLQASWFYPEAKYSQFAPVDLEFIGATTNQLLPGRGSKAV